MSADNWALCPKCQPEEVSEYDYTLREDYDIGISDGRLYIDYRGQCSVCGFKKKFKHEEKVV